MDNGGPDWVWLDTISISRGTARETCPSDYPCRDFTLILSWFNNHTQQEWIHITGMANIRQYSPRLCCVSQNLDEAVARDAAAAQYSVEMHFEPTHTAFPYWPCQQLTYRYAVKLVEKYYTSQSHRMPLSLEFPLMTWQEMIHSSECQHWNLLRLETEFLINYFRWRTIYIYFLLLAEDLILYTEKEEHCMTYYAVLSFWCTCIR